MHDEYKKIHWIEAVLTNDENATDNELVEYFMKEGELSEEEAKKWVSLRPDYVGEIVPRGSYLDVLG